MDAEFIKYSTEELIHENELILSVSENICRYCIRKKFEKQKMVACPNCGHATCKRTLEGVSMIWECIDCGYTVVGVTFLPLCGKDTLDYTIIVTEVEKSKIVKVAKLFGVNAPTVVRTLKEEGILQKTGKIDTIKRMLEELAALGITSECKPDFQVKYPELTKCGSC